MREKVGIITTSWDDGFWLDLKLAELLDKYSLKGTFYIPQKYTKKPLTKRQIRNIASRHEIGAHSLTHRDLTRLNAEELIREIRGSKIYLEDIIQKEVKMFAYPWGRFNLRLKKEVKSAGFQGARTTAKLNSNHNDPFEFGITLGVNISRIPLKNWFWAACLTVGNRVNSKAVWHLAGHSREVEYFGMWKALERLFEYVQGWGEKICLVNSVVLQK